jgi:hypothetical protein|tara:strand:+ start:228 stop:2090 length:1863 start_codon:yes stop_codon:yes gene_type:complete
MMAMPDSSDKRSMGFYVSRRVAHLNERWSWPALPRTKSTFLSALQPFQLEDINPKKQFTFYPFGSSTYDNIVGETDYKTGFDIFWRPSSNVQFTTTVNPDFGNVESDDVVVNLTAFETFFPEKRPFFLEGNEIFITTPRAEVRRSGGGSRFRGEPTTLVNTRRIGGSPRAPDLPDDVDIPDLELSRPTELLGAVKVTGQQGKVRYGVLGAFEDGTRFAATRDGLDHRAEQDGRDFGVVRAIYEDTSTGGRRAIGWISTLVSHPEEDARVHGIDAHFLSRDKRWLWDLQLMRSDVAAGIGAGGFVDAKFIPRRGITHTVNFDYLDDQLDISDLGFIRRNDSINFRYSYMRNESDFVRLKNRQLSWFISQEYNTDGRVVRSGLFTRTRWSFADNSRFSTQLNYFPDRWDDRNSDGSGSFRIEDRWIVGLGWSSDSAREIRLELDAGAEQEELHGWSYDASVEVTWRPNDRFSLSADIKYLDRNRWLLHWDGGEFTTYNAEIWQPLIEADLFLTAKQQLRFTAQWAGVNASQHAFFEVPLREGYLVPVEIPPGSNRDFSISRLTFQARYRWEIAPLSDLFVVYTRGSNLPSTPDEEFGDLLRDAWTNKIVDIFVVKLRYRLGN